MQRGSSKNQGGAILAVSKKISTQVAQRLPNELFLASTRRNFLLSFSRSKTLTIN
jgi:hypothetical protein